MGVLPTGGRGKPPHPGPAALGAASSRAPRGVVVVVVVVGLVGGAEGHPYVKRTNPSMIKRQKTLSLASALTSRFTFMYDFKCLTHTNTCTVCFVCVCVCVCVCVRAVHMYVARAHKCAPPPRWGGVGEEERSLEDNEQGTPFVFLGCGGMERK